jgi:hypothetical protein
LRPLFRLPGKVRHNSELPLDQHQLATVVHLVFLGPEQLFKARLCACVIGYRDHFRQKLRSLRI